MPRRRTLSDVGVATLKPGPARYAVPDPELRGHYVRVAPTGTKSYVAVARHPLGKQVWTTIGAADVMSIAAARDKTRKAIMRVRAGLPVLPIKSDTFKDVAENYLKRHVVANGLRSQDEIERCLGKYIHPVWQGREFVSLRRSDIARLLDNDKTSTGHGRRITCSPSCAGSPTGLPLATTTMCHPSREECAAPIPRPASAATLDDDELRAIWRQAEANGTFGDIVRLLLLTGQRREKIAAMKGADVTLDGEWRIPTEIAKRAPPARSCSRAGARNYPGRAPLGENPHVFPGRGAGYFKGFSPCKRAFDANRPVMPAWVLHDLRRTARSLISRAGVRPDIAERVLGHAISGVEGVYDRHSYRQRIATHASA